MEAMIKGEEILQYIPQRPPVVMIDSLYSVTEQGTKSGFTILEDNIFIKNGQLSSMGLIENIAQTAAASAGYYFKSNNQPVKLGFIGSVKNLEICAWPQIGEEIITEIQELQEVMNIKIIQGNTYLNDQKIASCEMKIFILDEPLV